MKYLMDTDHISILQRITDRESSTLVARMVSHPPESLAFSIVSFHEQTLGGHAYINRAKDAEALIRGYDRLGEILKGFSAAPILPFDAPAVAIFDGLRAQRIRVATMDLRIASIALARGLVLLTRNVRDFANIPGLATEDWTA